LLAASKIDVRNEYGVRNEEIVLFSSLAFVATRVLFLTFEGQVPVYEVVLIPTSCGYRLNLCSNSKLAFWQL